MTLALWCLLFLMFLPPPHALCALCTKFIAAVHNQYIFWYYPFLHVSFTQSTMSMFSAGIKNNGKYKYR
jgi:hypothetical protein